MTYVHEDRISEAHVSTFNGSSSGANTSEVLNIHLVYMGPYFTVVLCFHIVLVTRTSKFKLELTE
jgi:hypothetical protein